MNDQTRLNRTASAAELVPLAIAGLMRIHTEAMKRRSRKLTEAVTKANIPATTETNAR